MLNWFGPKCPVDGETKRWVDAAFGWLIEEMGLDTLRSIVAVLPTEEYFPDAFDGSEVSIRKMVERVCEYMDVEPASIDLRFYQGGRADRLHPLAADGSGGCGAAGTYRSGEGNRHIISLDRDHAANPELLVATIAHELAHVILLGEERLDPEDPDQEQMTDLLTVFYGFGIFNANSSFVFEQWTNSQYQGWQAGSAGYLSEEEFGYALALFAYVKGDSAATWKSFLKTNIRSHFKSALKYIEKTGDTPILKAVASGDEI